MTNTNNIERTSRFLKTYHDDSSKMLNTDIEENSNHRSNHKPTTLLGGHPVLFRDGTD